MAPTKRPGTPEVTDLAARYIRKQLSSPISTAQNTVSRFTSEKSITFSWGWPEVLKCVR